MSFTYNELKTAEKYGEKVGAWKGKPVFACSKANLESKGSGVYYIVYDDHNAIVARSSGGGLWQYGNVSASGNVSEFDQSVRYDKPAPQPKKAVAAATSTPGKEEAGHVSADFKMEMDVEAVLKQAREMTINSLLDGFNYGLD